MYTLTIAAHGGVNPGIDCSRPHRPVTSTGTRPRGFRVETQQRYFRADVGRRGGTTLDGSNLHV